jgi:hypothetical protein
MTAIATHITEQLVQDTCNEAGIQARSAAKAFHAKHGDRDACGFAWVNVYGVHCVCGIPVASLHKASVFWKQVQKPTPKC